MFARLARSVTDRVNLISFQGPLGLTGAQSSPIIERYPTLTFLYELSIFSRLAKPITGPVNQIFF